MADILLLEPDGTILKSMTVALTAAGHRCLGADCAEEGALLLQDGQRLLTILNARLPWSNCFSLLRTLEEKGWPVLFVTEDAGNMAHLRAMYSAPCGVLLAPFDASRLCQEVEKLLADSGRMLSLGNLSLDVEKREATLDGEVVELTAQEFALLQALMLSPDAALTRQELLRTAWGYQSAGETRTVDVHVQRLRKKLGTSCIETVYKLGYRLKMA